MHSNKPETHTIYKNPYDNPFYFGHYLNMGRHNAYLILQYVSDKFGYEVPEQLENDAKLNEFPVLNFGRQLKKQPDTAKKIAETITQHFPFLPKEADAETLCKMLREYLILLNTLRNKYSHYYHTEVVCRPPDLQEVFDSALEKARIRMKDNISMPDWEHLENKRDNKTYRYHLLDDEKTLTDVGLIFFTCLFLDKQYAQRFLSRIKGFKNTSEPAFKATLECFKQHCCRIPLTRLESSSISLDMLNELARCPKQLYPLLSEADKTAFHASVNEDTTVIEDEEDIIPQYIEMKRHSDRFPYFALRYFDNTKAFPFMKFHVYVAKWISRSYLKTINRVERERKIMKRLHSFGKLSEYSKENIPDNWKNLKEMHRLGNRELILLDEIEQYSPHYQIIGNRIGIELLKKEKEDGTIWPPLPDKESTNAHLKRPDAILSTYELQNLFLYHYLHNKKWINKSAEEFITDYINSFRCFCKDVKSGKIPPVANKDFKKLSKNYYPEKEKTELEKRQQKLREVLKDYDIPLSGLPDVMSHYLLGYKQINKFAETLRILDKKIKAVDSRKKACDFDRCPKAGEMATYLARDIVYFKHPESKEKSGKPNDQQYKVLQASLAYFPVNKSEISDQFRDLKLIGTSNDFAHPFLYRVKVNESNSIGEFYLNYLKKKAKWLEGIKRQLKNKELTIDAFIENYDYIIRLKTKTALEKDYTDTAVFLPRGLFNNTIKQALIKQGNELTENDNMIACLKLIMDSSQEFYNMPRYYPANDYDFSEEEGNGNPGELLEQVIAKSTTLGDDDKNKENKRSLNRLKKRIVNTEKELRYTQSTDRAIWLMVLELLRNEEKLSFEGESENLNTINDVLKKEIQMHLNLMGKKIVDTLPIRRYGEFRRFLKDRRLEYLLKYFTESNTITRERLVEEIEEYDKRRETIFETFQKFEKEMFHHFETDLFQMKQELDDQKKHPNEKLIEHKVYIQVAKDKLNLPDDISKIIDSDQFIKLRNTLLHNQIPYNEWIKSEINNKEGTIVSQIMNIIENKYEIMLQHLDSQINTSSN